MSLLDKLKITLHNIKENDTNYAYRNKLILIALGLAAEIGYPCGIRIDPEEPKWPVVFIELPVGQVSWHLPEHKETYDGHTTEEKYRRISKFISYK